MNTLTFSLNNRLLSCLVFIFYCFSYPVIADDSVIAGVDQERIKRLDKALSERVQQGQYAGISGLVLRGGKIVHELAVGWQDKERKIKLHEDTIFRIYSMSKAITSVAAMLLFEEGHFQIDDPIHLFIPEFKNLQVYVDGELGSINTVPVKRAITFRDLFTHTSGFTYHFAGETPVHKLYRKYGLMPGVAMLYPKQGDGEPVSHLGELIKSLSGLPLLHQPGERMSYGVSIDVLGRLIEIISNKRLDKFLDERMFAPLNMPDTGFVVPKHKLVRFASNYLWDNEQLKLLDAPHTSRYLRTGRILSGGAGMVSTLHDYMQFLQMLINGGELNGVRILSPVTVDFILSNHFLEEDMPRPLWMEQQGHSLGFALALDPIEMGMLSSPYTADWAGAASTFFWMDRKLRLTAVFMTQRTPLSSNTLMRQVRNLTYQAIIK